MGGGNFEEVGRTAPRDILVMVEPVRAICPISKLDFDTNYFRMARKKWIEQFTGVINLGDSDSKADEMNFVMEKLTPEEATDIRKQRDESLRMAKEKGVGTWTRPNIEGLISDWQAVRVQGRFSLE
ncbi:hypothetical protein Fot_32320 [Forsythia ovata]|uniref:Uncharacterized protein n=1 Tax=Forsythia ovata TaxID=205694 RepID=A0ABD1T7X1_9LAMI